MENAGQVIWFFGRPCAGKTTLAKSVEIELTNRGVRTIAFDGDELRKGINKDLGFSIPDRTENIRCCRISKLAGFKGLLCNLFFYYAIGEYTKHG